MRREGEMEVVPGWFFPPIGNVVPEQYIHALKQKTNPSFSLSFHRFDKSLQKKAEFEDSADCNIINTSMLILKRNILSSLSLFLAQTPWIFENS
jgi:hypothetical protein